MGIPTADGPDLIINRMREDVGASWSRVLAIGIVVAWVIFILGPFVFADALASDTFVLWTVIAAIAVLPALALPWLLRRNR